jgi:hypothetical protein
MPALRSPGNAEGKAEQRRLCFDHGFDLIGERALRNRRQDRRRQAEFVMDPRDQRQHRRGVNRGLRLVAAGEQVERERFGGERADLLGGVENLLRRRVSAAPRAEPTGIRHRCDEFRRAARARHRREDDRLLD